MNDLDNQLRGVFAELASDAPRPARLADAVHQRHRRHQRHRLAAVAGGTTLAVALVAGGAATIDQSHHHNKDVQQVKILQVAMPAGMKQRPAPSPVDLGWIPDGFGKPRLIMLGPGAWGIDVRRGDGVAIGKGFAAVEVQIMAGKPKERTSPGKLTQVTVGGKPGSLYWVPPHAPGIDKYGHYPPEAEGPYAELIYQRTPGQWIRIIAQNSAGDVDMGLTPADLTKIATSLVDRPRAFPDVIRLAVLPGQVEWGRVTNESYRVLAQFALASTSPRAVGQNDMPNAHNGSFDAPISVQVVPGDSLDLEAALPQSAMQGGNTTAAPSPPPIPPSGSVYKVDKATTAVFRLASNPKLVVIVREKNSFGLSDADLLKVAASVRLGPAALVKAR